MTVKSTISRFLFGYSYWEKNLILTKKNSKGDKNDYRARFSVSQIMWQSSFGVSFGCGPFRWKILGSLLDLVRKQPSKMFYFNLDTAKLCSVSRGNQTDLDSYFRLAHYSPKHCIVVFFTKKSASFQRTEVVKRVFYLWKAATNCGKSVISIFLAMVVPASPPIAMQAAICVRTSCDGAIYPRVDAIPPVTPIWQKKSKLIQAVIFSSKP